jgi:hypothetical protein
MLECSECIAKHGRPGCPATLEAEDGKPVCAWCTDGEPCPFEQRRLKAAKKKNSGTPPAASEAPKPASEPEDEEKTMSNEGIDTPKLCKRPGCQVELSSANRVGLCRAHVRYRGDEGEHAIAVRPKANGVEKRTNGVGKPANGHAIEDVATPKNGSNGAAELAGDVIEQRLNRLLLNLPVAEKSLIAQRYLRGEI